MKHPNIVELMAICPEKEKLFLIFEFMSMDLKQYLDITKSQYLYTVYNIIPNKMTEQKNLSGTPNFFHYKKLTPTFDLTGFSIR